MTEFIPFDSFDEAMEEMRKDEESANRSMLPAQIRMRDSSLETQWWFQPTADYMIFGHAWSEKEGFQSSIRSGCSTMEAHDERVRLQDSRKRGYIFGRAFSVVMPDGELGDTHASQICPISEELFEKARACGWSPQNNDPELLDTLIVIGHAMMLER